MRKLFTLVLCLSFASVAYSQDGSCVNGQCKQSVLVEKSISCEKGRCWLNGELTVKKEKQVAKTTSVKKQYITKRFRLFRKR